MSIKYPEKLEKLKKGDYMVENIDTYYAENNSYYTKNCVFDSKHQKPILEAIYTNGVYIEDENGYEVEYSLSEEDDE